jgi:succinate dehydrogenase / fumarate reductase cytochrome b subunit
MILFRYKWGAGLIAWMVHRFTGIALTLYIFVHLYVLSSLRDPERFESMMGLMQNPLVKLGELGLLALVAAHALNGVRVTLLEFGMPTRLHKPAAILGAAGLAVLLMTGLLVFFGGGH